MKKGGWLPAVALVVFAIALSLVLLYPSSSPTGLQSANQPPHAVAQLQIQVDGPTVVNLDGYFSDADGDALTFSADDPQVQISGSTLTFSPALPLSSDYVVTLSVSDGKDTIAKPFTFVVQGTSSPQQLRGALAQPVASVPPPKPESLPVALQSPSLPQGTFRPITINLPSYFELDAPATFSTTDSRASIQGETLTFYPSESGNALIPVAVTDAQGMTDAQVLVRVPGDGPFVQEMPKAPLLSSISVGRSTSGGKSISDVSECTPTITACCIINQTPGTYSVSSFTDTGDRGGAFGDSCISTNLSGVTIDCGGSTISTSAGGTASGIRLDYENSAVKNCNIVGNYFSSILVQGNNSVVDGNTITITTPVSGFAIDVRTMSGLTVQNNVITGPVGLGISYQQASGGSNIQITGNTIDVSANAGSGIALDNSATIDNNSVIAGTGIGISIVTTANSFNVTDNSVVTNGSGIISASGLTNSRIQGNIVNVTGASSKGIFASALLGTQTIENNTFSNNTVVASGSTLNGIGTSGGSSAAFRQNNNITDNSVVFTSCTGTGGSSNRAITNPGTSNVVSRNVIQENGTGSCMGIGASTFNASRITDNRIDINGGTVSWALEAEVSYNSLIRNNTIRTIGTGVDHKGMFLCCAVNGTTITNNSVITGGTGALTVDHGINLNTNADNNTISSNVISTSGVDRNGGIHLDATSTNDTVFNNTVSTTGSSINNFGMSIASEEANHTVYNNSFHTNGTNTNIGILVRGSFSRQTTNINITNNSIFAGGTGTQNYGIWINDLANFVNGTIVQGNLIMTNGSSSNYGVFIDPATDTSLINNNTIITNGTGGSNHGVVLLGTLLNNITGNSIIALGTGVSHGVLVTGRANRTRVVNNTISASTAGSNAIQVDRSENTTIDANQIVAATEDSLVLNRSLSTSINQSTLPMFRGSLRINETQATVEYVQALSLLQNFTFASVVNISSNHVFVNTTDAQGSQLNASANITLQGLTSNNPYPIVDISDNGTFIRCPSSLCTRISYNGSALAFNVSHFTTFSSNDSLLTTTVTTSPDPVNASGVLNYTIVLNNTDGNASNVTVIVLYPPQVSFVGSEPTPNVSNTTFNIGDLASNGTFQLNISMNVSGAAGGLVINGTINITSQNSSGATFNTSIAVSTNVSATTSCALLVLNTSTISTNQTCDVIQIAPGATVTVNNALAGNQSVGFFARVAFSMPVDATMNASGKGFVGGNFVSAGSGPGAGVDNSAGTGAGHGGRGGGANGAAGGIAYDQGLMPLQPGSGGGPGNAGGSTGGFGGGVIFISAGSASINGTIAVDGLNGTDGTPVAAFGAGGGAGGSIWIYADNLSGTGNLTAAGGNGSNASTGLTLGGGGGGGGRIFVQFNSSTFAASKLNVSGGFGGLAVGGGAINGSSGQGGTLAFLNFTGDALTISQSWRWQANDRNVWNFTTITIQNALTRSNDTVLNFTPAAFIVSNSSIERDQFVFNVSIIANSVDFIASNLTNANFTNITAATVDVDVNSTLNGSGSGFFGGNFVSNGGGPGGGADVSGPGTGAGHGGRGGVTNGVISGGVAYDLSLNPREAGSGGGPGNAAGSTGGAGGGIIAISASSASINGTIVVDGLNGTDGAAGSAYGAGGGSGGSVNIYANSLSGSGLLLARGGNGSNGTGGFNIGGGGGAGGKIIAQFNTSSFPLANVNVSGGFGGLGTGSNGGQGQVGTAGLVNLTDNSLGISGGWRWQANDRTVWNFTTLTLQNAVSRTNDTILNLSPTTLLLTNSTIQQDQSVFNLSVNAGSAGFVASNITSAQLANFTITTLEVDALSQFNSTATGYTGGVGTLAGNGPGAGTDVGGVGTGAGHGGYGAGGSGTPIGGIVYDSSFTPFQAGSGGGPGNSGGSVGGFGGGAIILSAVTASINGSLSADGVNGTDGTAVAAFGTGGGSGGSIKISVSSLSGTGTLTARGGNGSNGAAGAPFGGGGAGGGRVFVRFNTSTLPTANLNVSGGFGGLGNSGNGSPGTVGTVGFLNQTDNSLAIVQGWRWQQSDQSSLSFSNVTASAQTVMHSDGPQVNATNTYQADGVSFVTEQGITVINAPRFLESNATINASNATSALMFNYSTAFQDSGSNYTSGSRIFLRNSSVAESNFTAFSAQVGNLSTNTRLSGNRIFANSSGQPGLNVSANLTLYSSQFSNPHPTFDATDSGSFLFCTSPRCTQTAFSPGSPSGLFFVVSSFTSYSSAESILLFKSDTPDPVTAGSTLNYTILINTSDNVFNLSLNETYPAQVSFVSSSPSPTSGNSTFNFTTLAANTSTTINITVTVGSNVPNGTVINNTANLSFQNSSGAAFFVNVTENTTVLTPTACTLLVLNTSTISANQTCDVIQVAPGATLTVNNSLAGNVSVGLFARLAFELPATSSITLNGQGFIANLGPGAGHNQNGEGTGAGHGGPGGVANTGLGGIPYDSSLNPALLGSGGGTSNFAPGGAGGGALIISAGNASVNGSISADANAGGAGGAGGGSGGTINIFADRFDGTGSLSAKGGLGTNAKGAGGAGGRIVAKFNSSTFAISSVLVTGGGNTGGTNFNGQHGTAGFVDLDDNVLSITQGWRWQTSDNTMWNYATVNLTNAFTRTNDSTLAFNVTRLILSNSSIAGEIFSGGRYNLTINASTISMNPSNISNATIINISAENVSVASGSVINASGTGFGPSSGPGAGKNNNGEGTGAGHGAPGGVANTGLGGIPYDSSLNPILAGSGGGTSNFDAGGFGGGAVLITATRTSINGTISADGLAGGASGAGGGSGGTINIFTDNFDGNGALSAVGGLGTVARGGGGSGGRILARFNTSTFNITQASVTGGGNTGGTNANGEHGSLGFLSSPTNTLTILQGWRWQTSDFPIWNFTLVNLTNAFTHTNDSTLAFNVTRLILSNSSIAGEIFSGGRYNLSINASVVSLNPSNISNATIINLSAENVSIASGSIINGSGTGFGPNSGPGQGKNSNGEATGAGYGGLGGTANTGLGGMPYNSSLNPLLQGSGGGTSNFDAGGFGGGAVLISAQRLSLNGSINVDGLNGGAAGAGGGSGGAINILADSFDGTGNLSAKGGTGTNARGGGGGGGRIIARFNTTTFNITQGRVTGGANTGGTNFNGQPGSLGFIALPTNTLNIYEGWRWQTSDLAIWTFPITNLTNAWTRTNDTTLAFSVTTLALANSSLQGEYRPGGTYNLSINASAMSMNPSNISNASVVNISVLNFTLGTGGLINGSGTGFGPTSGPGQGKNSNGVGTGGGYGGYGGFASVSIGGNAYDSSLNPGQQGSGGGTSNFDAGGNGGGAVVISANRTTIDGSINVDGLLGGASGAGGGSGGAINVLTNALDGAGSLSSAGGAGTNGRGGGGSGGRIVARFNTSAFNITQAHVTAGQGSVEGAGENGTLGFINLADNSVSIREGWRWQTSDQPLSFSNITVSSAGVHSDGAVINATGTYQGDNITFVTERGFTVLSAPVLRERNATVRASNSTSALMLNYSSVFDDAGSNYTSGSRIFLRNSSVAESNFTAFTAQVSNLSANTRLSGNRVFANSSFQTGLNVSANLTLYSSQFSNPHATFDATDSGSFLFCASPRCTQSAFVAGSPSRLFFVVSSFTSYSSAESILLFKSDTPDPVSPGGTLNYTILINTTDNVFNLSLNESYPAQVSFVSSSPAPTSGNSTFNFTTLAANTSTTVNITVTVGSNTPVGFVINNTVNLSFQNVSGASFFVNVTENTTVNVTCPLVVSASTTLGTNISCPATAINVQADNVVLDCAGHLVNYSTVSDGDGVFVAANNVTVKNCVIGSANSSLAGNGINLQNVNTSSILNDTVTPASGTSVRVTSGGNVTIMNNTLIDPTISALLISSNNTVRDNYLMSNSITLDVIGSNTTVLNNTAITSGSFGSAMLITGQNVTVQSNIVSAPGTSANGIKTTTSSNLTISNNSVVGGFNGLGIDVESTNNSTIQDNVAIASAAGVSFAFDTSSFNLFTGNRLLSRSLTIFRSNNNDVRNNAIIFLVIQQSNNSIFTNNTVYDTSDALVMQAVSVNNTFVNTTIVSLGGKDVELSQSPNNSFVNTTLLTNVTWINSDGTSSGNDFTNTLFQVPRGSIRQSGNFTVPISTLISQQKLNVSLNRSFINTTNLSFLNLSSQITLLSVNITGGSFFVDPEDDGTFVNCDSPECVDSGSSGSTYIFNVTHWTSYAISTNSTCPLSVTSSTTLNASISCPATAINVKADNLVLDCAGFTVNYSSADVGFGINATGRNNVTIRNCTVQQTNASISGANGIVLSGTNNSNAMNNTVLVTGILSRGVDVVSAQGNSVTNTSVNGPGPGIAINGNNITLAQNNVVTTTFNGIAVSGVTNSSIVNSTVLTTANAIETSASTGNIIAGNTLTSTANRGVELGSSANNTLNQNIISSTSGAGLLVTTSNGNQITNNTVVSESNNALFSTASSSNNVYFGNFINSSTGRGFYLDSGSNNTITGNIIKTTAIEGLQADGTNGTINNNTVTSTNGGGFVIGGNTQNVTNGLAIAAFGISMNGGQYDTFFNVTSIGTNTALLISVGTNHTFTDVRLQTNGTWISTGAGAGGNNLTNVTFETVVNGSIRVPATVTIPLNTNVNIAKLAVRAGRAFLNSTNLSFLNTTAVITLTNNTLTTPQPIVDFNDDNTYTYCNPPQCTAVSSASNLSFTVASFTSYSASDNITIDKNDSVDPVLHGQTLTYGIQVNNTGNDTVFNVTVRDTYPPGVAFVSAQPAPTSGNGTFALGNLAAGATTTVNITVTVGSNVANGTILNNTANLTFNNSIGATVTTIDSELTTVVGAPRVFTSKTDSPDPIARGALLSYTITVSNVGDEIAYNTTAIENYPLGVSFVGSTPAPTSGNDTFTVGTLGLGQSTTINITVQVGSNVFNGTILNNSYNLTFANFSGVGSTLTNSTTTRVLGIPVIVAIKNDNPDPVVRGSLLNYTILINNTGDDTAFNVTLSEAYPSGVSFVSAQPAPLGNSTFTLGSLAPNQSTLINITVRVGSNVANGSILNNTVNASFRNTSGQQSGVSDTELTTVAGFPAMSITKIDSPDPVVSGNLVTYTITVTNSGDEIAYNVTAVEGYPGNIAFVSSSPAPTSGNDTFAVGNLLAGQSTTINITVNVSSTFVGTLVNTVNLSFANVSGQNSSANATQSTTVIPVPTPGAAGGGGGGTNLFRTANVTREQVQSAVPQFVKVTPNQQVQTPTSLQKPAVIPPAQRGEAPARPMQAPPQSVMPPAVAGQASRGTSWKLPSLPSLPKLPSLPSLPQVPSWTKPVLAGITGALLLVVLAVVFGGALVTSVTRKWQAHERAKERLAPKVEDIEAEINALDLDLKRLRHRVHHRAKRGGKRGG